MSETLVLQKTREIAFADPPVGESAIEHDADINPSDDGRFETLNLKLELESNQQNQLTTSYADFFDHAPLELPLIEKEPVEANVLWPNDAVGEDAVVDEKVSAIREPGELELEKATERARLQGRLIRTAIATGITGLSSSVLLTQLSSPVMAAIAASCVALTVALGGTVLGLWDTLAEEF